MDGTPTKLVFSDVDYASEKTSYASVPSLVK